MANPAAGEPEAGEDVLRFQVWHLDQESISGLSVGEQVQHVGDPNPHPPDARAAPALFGITRDAIAQIAHPATFHVMHSRKHRCIARHPDVSVVRARLAKDDQVLNAV
jgi:hypothetical protein